MPSCRGFRVPAVAAAASVIAFAYAGAESWSQVGEATLAPFQVMSTLKPSYSLLSADSATVNDGAYSTSDDGTASLAEITSGAWDTTSGPLVLGGGNNTDSTALGKYTVRLTGSGTSFNTAVLNANFGQGRLEILNGATVDASGNVQFGYSGNSARISSTQTVVVVDSTFVLTGASMTLGYRNASYPSSLGRAFLYATNSTFTSEKPGSTYPYCYFKNGRYVFKDCTYTGWQADYAFNVQIGAEVVIDGSTFTTARYRIGDSGFSHSDGSPTMRMLSGSLTTDKFQIGVGNSSVTSILHQAGGTIEINGDIALSTSTQPARLQLSGGTLMTSYVRGGDGTKARQPSGTGFAHLLGDGGTIKCRQVNKTYPFISGMDIAEVGDGGLTLDDNGFSCRVVQGFVDAPGASGTLTKTGNGTISLVSPGEYSVSTTRVARGTLLVQTNGTSTAVSMDTAIVVVDGATLSMVGNAETLGLASLKVSDSTLALDPGDSIVVTGDAEFGGLTLNFSSLPSVGELRDFLVVNGTISAASANAVKSAVFANGFAEGTYGSVTVSQSGGATVFTFSVKEAAVISGETAWRGPGSAWSDGANWSDGAPGESDEAVVGDVSAPSPIVVSGAQDVGAVTFAGGPYEISGSGSLALSSPGASFVRSNVGTNIVAVLVSAVGDMPVAVATDSSLELAGTLSSAGLTKTGGGRLVLSGANALSGTVSFGAGMNVVSNTFALSGATVVSVADATLRFAEGIGGTYPSTETFTLASSNAAGAVVFDCKDDVTLTSFTPASGALVKRGAGKLTLDASTGHITALSSTSGDGQNGGGVADGSRKTFAEDGTPPSGGYGALTVAEGELVVRGSGAETLATVGKFIVGMNVAECRAQPVLTFDNVTVSEPSLNQFQQHEVGYKCAVGGITNPVLRVLNGATLNTRGVMMDFQYSAVARWPVIAVTNSTVTASANDIQFSTVRQSTGHGSLLASNSTLRANSFAVNGRTYSRLTACDIRGYSGDYTRLTADRNVAGEVLFDGGTTLRCNAFAMDDYDSRYGSALTLAFDDATWNLGPDDLTINDSNMLQTRPKTFDVRAGGLTLVVASGRTLRTSVPFAGIGTLSLTGGTLAFEAGAFAITGGVHAASGAVVDFSSAGAVSNFTASGLGTFRGATFSGGLRIAPAIGDGWAVGATPLFDGCSFAGRVVVDCGHETGTPLPMCQTPVVVARYTGTAPDVSSWRVSGTGMAHAGGTFTAENGQISMTVASKGFTIIFR